MPEARWMLSDLLLEHLGKNISIYERERLSYGRLLHQLRVDVLRCLVQPQLLALLLIGCGFLLREFWRQKPFEQW